MVACVSRCRPIAGSVTAAGLTAAGLTAATDRLLTRSGVSGRAAWTRTNYRGRTVSLTGGASAAVGATTAAWLFAPPGWRRAVLLAGGSAAVAGAYDDLLAPRVERGSDKGWRGHLAALRSGRVSGGVVKVGAIGTGALLAAHSLPPGPSDWARSVDSARSARRWVWALPSAALIAASANLINLFDLRPGRAGKLTLAAAALLLGGLNHAPTRPAGSAAPTRPSGSIAAAVGAAALTALPADLAERRMLGDLGANTLGALLGLRVCACSPATRAGALAVSVGLSVLSERVSFSALIDRTPILRTVDRWGRLIDPDRPPGR